jgi:diacylglycerol kinase family enzyme
VRVAGLKGLYGDTVETDDGYHEVLLVRNPKNPVILQETLIDLLKPGKESPHIWRGKVKKIHFVSEEPVDWVLDGEFGGSLTDVTIENVEKAIRIMKTPKQEHTKK